MTRFNIYIKAGSDGVRIGDCPFSQRVMLFLCFKLPESCYSLITIDILNKSSEFLKLNPEGTVPVLVDKENNKIISDSGEIILYINKIYPEPDMKVGYDGPAVTFSYGIFGKLVALLKNTDKTAIPDLQNKLTCELNKLEDYLGCADHSSKFLLDDEVMELDCQLPKLRHVLVAGQYYQKYEIPRDLINVWSYIEAGQSKCQWNKTCCLDDDIISGWARHNIMRVE